MRITETNVTDLRDAIEEFRNLADDIESEIELWLDAREDRSAYDREDIASARETIEGAVDEIATAASNVVEVIGRRR